ncbi:MAG: FKBP-type peptidyl-prolyl cis-trans isomerase [Bacteroidales bacterium]|nr:FKBP-type peptidyl-prolyl cis-trans isomerase [Bacteroidales bacterium]
MKRNIILILAVLALFSCAKQQQENYYASQEAQIERFVNAAGGVRTVHNGGATRVVIAEGTTADSLAANGVVSFYYAGYILSGTSVSSSNLFDTNNENLNWPVSDSTSFNILTVKLDEEPLLPGLKSGLTGVKGGEESYILFTGKYGYGNHSSGTIPANASLVYHIWVESISNE